MSYCFTKVVNTSFDMTIDIVAARLKEEGFGVLTDIDVKATLKKKIDVEFRNYRILGACDARFAHKALLTEEKIGVMLPCNVVVQETSDGRVEVSAVDPVASMKSVENAELGSIVSDVSKRLERVIESL